jgi:hypothetical protein
VIGFGAAVIGEHACSEGFGVRSEGFGGAVIGSRTCSEGFGAVL